MKKFFCQILLNLSDPASSPSLTFRIKNNPASIKPLPDNASSKFAMKFFKKRSNSTNLKRYLL